MDVWDLKLFLNFPYSFSKIQESNSELQRHPNALVLCGGYLSLGDLSTTSRLVSLIKSCKCGFECCKQPSSFHFYIILMLIAKYVIFPYLIQNIFFVRFHFRSSPIFYTNWNHPTNDDSYITDKTFAFFPNWLTSSIPTNRS